MKTLQNSIVQKIQKEEILSPFLFIAKNTELAHTDILNLAHEVLEYFWVPKTFLYHFSSSDKNIKIGEIRNFMQNVHIKSSYKIQIFFIENIEKLTQSAANSLLKILEEPGKWNLIFLSSRSENAILETILSRVQSYHLDSHSTNKESAFFQDMLANYIHGNSWELISYFFANKLEKSEYITFLENIIIYAKKHFVFIHFLDEINSDIYAIEKNNVSAKYIVDKWILKIK